MTKDLPSFDETCAHLAMGVFDPDRVNGQFVPKTPDKMRKQAKANRRHAMKAWRRAATRNGLGKKLDFTLREFWTQEQKDAEAEAFAFYDAIYQAIKAEIDLVGADVQAVHEAHLPVVAQRAAIQKDRADKIKAHRQLVAAETSKFPSQAAFEADPVALKKVQDSLAATNAVIAEASKPLQAEIDFDAAQSRRCSDCVSRIERVAGLRDKHTALQSRAIDT